MNAVNNLRKAMAEMLLAFTFERGGDKEQAALHRDNSALYVRRAAVEAEKAQAASVRNRTQR